MVQADSDFREQHLRSRDFLGAFGVVETDSGVLMVSNRRQIDGREVSVWDLPGGQVEPGELLGETLRRELREEIDVVVEGEAPFLFYQEGEKVNAGVRRYAWRSFFFAVSTYHGSPQACGEIEAVRWVPRAELPSVLTAPYHDSFARWLQAGGRQFDSVWRD